MLNSKYYDHPDGQDFSGKLAATNKYAAVAGLGTATYDVVLYSKPKGISNIVGRYAMHVGPLMGIATAFTTVTYAATKFRGKDDSLNYVLGGIAAGGVVGAWAKSFPTGCLAGIILAGAAFTKHVGLKEGWGFNNPNWQQGTKTLNMQKSDQTVFADPGKKWSNGY